MAESRSLVKLCGASAIALLSLTSGAFAGGSLKDAPVEERKFTYTFTATGTSDYIFRGISLSDNDPAIQGSLTATYGIFYATIWGSSLDWSTDSNANVELDYYAGIKPTWGKANFDFGVLYYTYPSTVDGYVDVVSQTGPKDGTSIIELKAGVSGEILPKLTGTANYFYSPDYNSYEYSVFEGSLAYALPKTWVFDPTVSGTVGYQDSYGARVTDYTYWNAGLTLVVEKLAFDFRYWDTDLNSADCTTYAFGGNTCSEKFVFTTTVTLP